MWLLCLVLLMSTLSFNFFVTNIRLSIVNRIVINTPKELFQCAIPYIQEQSTVSLYFDREQLAENLDSYYETNLKKYCKDYEYFLYFYEDNNGTFCVDDYCTSVEVIFRAALTNINDYERTMFYYIAEMK